MKTIKLRLSLIVAVIMQSCSSIIPFERDLSERKIDYTLYNSRENIFTVIGANKVNNIKTGSLQLSLNANNSDKDYLFKQDLISIEEKFNVNLELTEFDMYQIKNSGNLSLENYLKEGLINEIDYLFISEFQQDIGYYGLDDAIENIEKRILTSSLSEENINRYTLFLNTFLIANEYYLVKQIQKTSSIKKTSEGGTVAKMEVSKEGAACAVSIAANAVSTYGLTSCFIPGPNCWGAIAGKALSLAGIYLSC